MIDGDSATIVDGTLSVSGVGDQVLYFAERPGREIGRQPLVDFIQAWDDGLFGDDPPNAAVSWNADGARASSAIEITDISSTDDTLTLGRTAVAHVRVSFELVDHHTVCRVDVAASPEPVFLDEPGGDRVADMYVRMGNSTRKLLTDETLDYSRTHWS